MLKITINVSFIIVFFFKEMRTIIIVWHKYFNDKIDIKTHNDSPKIFYLINTAREEEC